MRMKLVLILLAAFGVFGCTEKNGAARGAGEVTTILLTDSTGIDDRSFNAAAWRGILDFFGESWGNTPGRGRLFEVVTAQTEDFYETNLRNAVDEGHDLIIATGFTWAADLGRVAADWPDQNFLIVDVDWVGLPNVMQAVFAEHDGSFLVGAAAALKAVEDGIPNPRFGFIGGIPGALITKFQVGFVQGVLSILPDAEIVDYYVNSWGAPALARTQALNWYGSGVYAIYSAAGASGNGTIIEAMAQRQAGRNVWAIGVDSDQFEDGIYNGTDSAVLTSMVKRVESSVVYALNAVRDGNFSGRTITFDLALDGVEYSRANPALSPEINARLDEIKRQIISGEIVVYPTYAEALMWVPGFPRGLMAVDG